MLETRGVCSSTDLVGVLVYGTAESRNELNFEGRRCSRVVRNGRIWGTGAIFLLCMARKS